jgi:hypothetical protein
MKTKLSFALVGLVLILSLLSCTVVIGNDYGGSGTVRGSGNIITETRTVKGVSGVELSLPGTLHIKVGNSESLQIDADDNLMSYIETNVGLGRLVIESRPGTDLRPTRPIRYELTVTELGSVTTSSSGDIEVEPLQARSFSITINSSGNISLASLDCTSLNVKISSSGDIKLSQLKADSISVDISSSGNLDVQDGQVKQQDIRISSSGEYNARNLESPSANVVLTSSGNAIVRVSDRLTGRLSSSGDINYIGSPDLNVSMTSSGRTVQVGK